MALGYSIREGLAGFRRARYAAVTATSALTITLALMGLVALMVWQGAQVVDWLKQRVGEIEVFVSDAADAAQTQALGERLRLTRGIESVSFISAEEATESFLGEEAALLPSGTLLPASYRVQVASRYATADSLENLVQTIQSLNRVDEVIYNQPMIAKVEQNLRVLTPIALGVAGLVLFAGIFLIGDTIRLSVYARRMLIRTMKLVGATNSFIRRPFLIEGLVQGAIAGILACLLVLPLYGLILDLIPQMSWPGGSPIFSMITLFLCGILLGWLGSYIAVRRFIKSVRID